jgi:hypothetical protein
LGSLQIKGESRIQTCIRLKIQELCRLKMELWRAVETQVEAWRLPIEPWRVCRPLVADLHYVDEEQDQSKQSDPDPHKKCKEGSGSPS